MSLNHEKVCRNKDFLKIILLTQKRNISEINQHMKSDKIFQIIYADIEPSTKKVDNRKKNPKKSLTTKVGKHIL